MSGGGDGKKTIVEKILTPFVELREMFAELSPRFVALVTAGVLFCVLVVGFVLVFSEPSPARNSAPQTDSAAPVTATAVIVTIRRSTAF